MTFHDILDLNDDISMTLPKRCSFRDKYLDCPLPPSYIISVTDNEEELSWYVKTTEIKWKSG
jgi:hypothetical protein